VRQSNTETATLETIKQINDTGQVCSVRAVHKIQRGNRDKLMDTIKKLEGKKLVRNNGTDKNPDWFAIDTTPDPELF